MAANPEVPANEDIVVEAVNFECERAKIWTDPSRAMRWIATAINPSTPLYELYRTFAADLESDVVRGATYFQWSQLPDKENAEGAVRAVATRNLRLIRRFLLRNYAFRAANDVGRLLHRWGDFPAWLLWIKDLLIPRLALAILAGFVILSSNSIIVDSLRDASEWEHRYTFSLLLTSSLTLLFLLAFADVQRRVGRRPLGTILRRATVVCIIGTVHALLGGVLVFCLGTVLSMHPTPAHVILCSACSLVLGFVFQLFWQERSIADPL